MTKLYFYMGAMNCGKTAYLLQTRHNYEERGMMVKVYTPDMFKSVSSRIGLCTHVFHRFSRSFEFDNVYEEGKKPPDVLLIDEAQFLTNQQVWQLSRIACSGIPVICFGLRTDFTGKPFEGSITLLSIADKIIELKSICWCGKKATMNLRVGDKEDVIEVGEQVDIHKEKYTSVCMIHFLEKKINK